MSAKDLLDSLMGKDRNKTVDEKATRSVTQPAKAAGGKQIAYELIADVVSAKL